MVVSQILVLGTFLQKIYDKTTPSPCVHGHYLFIRERIKKAWYSVVKIAFDAPSPHVCKSWKMVVCFCL